MRLRIPRRLGGGKAALEKGRRNEESFIKAFVEPTLPFTPPPWWRSIRRATPEEDQHGIDAVLETDVGKIFFQIKSSEFGVRKHLAHRRRAVILPLIVNRNMGDAHIRDMAIDEAAQYREQLLSQRAPK